MFLAAQQPSIGEPWLRSQVPAALSAGARTGCWRHRLTGRVRWPVALLAMAGILATELGTEFIPRLSEHAIVIATQRLASISLDEAVRHGTEIEKLLLEQFPDEIERIWTRHGTAEVATDPMGWDQGDVFITLTPVEQVEAGPHPRRAGRADERRRQRHAGHGHDVHAADRAAASTK